jgi:Mce-associated membrane protein
MSGARATVFSVLTAVIVLSVGVSVWSWSQARASHGGNISVADVAATADVTDQVGAAVKQVFSYDYANLDRTERAASSLLVDAAVAQYQANFAAAKQQAVAQKLVRTTSIDSIGVRELTGAQARLLVFVDQQTLNTGTDQQTSSVAALDITARKIDGAWKIAGMTAL